MNFHDLRFHWYPVGDWLAVRLLKLTGLRKAILGLMLTAILPLVAQLFDVIIGIQKKAGIIDLFFSSLLLVWSIIACVFYYYVATNLSETSKRNALDHAMRELTANFDWLLLVGLLFWCVRKALNIGSLFDHKGMGPLAAWTVFGIFVLGLHVMSTDGEPGERHTARSFSNGI